VGVTIDKSLGEDNVIALSLSTLNDMDISVSHTVPKFEHKSPVLISITTTNIIFKGVVVIVLPNQRQSLQPLTNKIAKTKQTNITTNRKIEREREV
jgi:hypothetical protein